MCQSAIQFVKSNSYIIDEKESICQLQFNTVQVASELTLIQ